MSPTGADALAADFRKAFPGTPLSRLGSAVRGEGRLLDGEGRPATGRPSPER
ncbi:MAG: hypothetical protein ACKOQ9_01595 [Verrucomicrobiota bacterium]